MSKFKCKQTRDSLCSCAKIIFRQTDRESRVFSGANLGFMTPPPAFLVDAFVPDEYKSTASRRRLASAAVANGEELEDEGAPASDLPDPNETGQTGHSAS